MITLSLERRNSELLSDFREYQRRLKDTKAQLEKRESAELEARAEAHDSQHALEQARTDIKEKDASSKAAIGSLQLEIKKLKTK